MNIKEKYEKQLSSIFHSNEVNSNDPDAFCQTPGYVFRQGVDFVLPLSQEEEEEEEEEEPSPKSIRRGCT